MALHLTCGQALFTEYYMDTFKLFYVSMIAEEVTVTSPHPCPPGWYILERYHVKQQAVTFTTMGCITR